MSPRLAEGLLTNLRGGEEPSRVRPCARAVFGMQVKTLGPVGIVGVALEGIKSQGGGGHNSYLSSAVRGWGVTARWNLAPSPSPRAARVAGHACVCAQAQLSVLRSHTMPPAPVWATSSRPAARLPCAPGS